MANANDVEIIWGSNGLVWAYSKKFNIKAVGISPIEAATRLTDYIFELERMSFDPESLKKPKPKGFAAWLKK